MPTGVAKQSDIRWVRSPGNKNPSTANFHTQPKQSTGSAPPDALEGSSFLLLTASDYPLRQGPLGCFAKHPEDREKYG